MSSDESVEEQATEPKKEEQPLKDLSILLPQLYRLIYDSLENSFEETELESSYSSIVKDFDHIVSGISNDSSPKSPKELIDIAQELLNKAENELMNGKVDTAINSLQPKVALVKYCEADNIDQALLLVLQFKMEHPTNDDEKKENNDISFSSSTSTGKDKKKSKSKDKKAKAVNIQELISYVHDASQGWSSKHVAAIHALIHNLNESGSHYRYDKRVKEMFKTHDLWTDELSNDEEKRTKLKKENRQIEAKRDEYLRFVARNKYERKMLLFEILLKEGASTTIMYSQGGWV